MKRHTGFQSITVITIDLHLPNNVLLHYKNENTAFFKNTLSIETVIRSIQGFGSDGRPGFMRQTDYLHPRVKWPDFRFIE